MNKSDITRDYCMLSGPLAKKGYDWWWHSFTAEHVRTGERKSFYIEYFLCNPDLAQEQPMLVWNDPEGRQAGKRPSYCMINVGFWGKEKGQLHRFFPWSQVSVPLNAPLNLKAGDCTCTETHMTGHVKVTPEEAKSLIQKTDKRRASYCEYYASKKWGAVDAYDFCLNSSALGLGGTVELIQAMVAHKEHPIPSPTEVDPTQA